MNRNRFLSILLTAVIFAQSVIAGWGHSHAHIASGSHSHADVGAHPHHNHDAGEHRHVHDSHEHQPLPNCPIDKEDCSVCRHLALAAILLLDLESLTIGDATELAPDRTYFLVSANAVGLYRPRAPPKLN